MIESYGVAEKNKIKNSKEEEKAVLITLSVKGKPDG